MKKNIAYMKSCKIVMILFMMVAVSSCQFLSKNKVPPELTGTWETPDQKYSGRFLKITENEIWLGIGNNQINKYVIDKVKKKDLKQNMISYVISCKNYEGDRFNFSFTYDPADNGSIKFAHQKGIWKKTKTE